MAFYFPVMQLRLKSFKGDGKSDSEEDPTWVGCSETA